MNKIITLIKTVLAIAAVAVSVYAYSPKDSAEYLKALDASVSVVPVKVVAPEIGQDYEGQTINVTFTVKADGKVSNLRMKTFVDIYTETKIAEALNKWEFKPRTKDGVAVDTTVILPIKVNASN